MNTKIIESVSIFLISGMLLTLNSCKKESRISDNAEVQKRLYASDVILFFDNWKLILGDGSNVGIANNYENKDFFYSTTDANGDNIADDSGRHYTRARDQTDSAIQDASYIALRNLTIGYTLDNNLTKKFGVNSFRLYAAATNLLYLWSSDYTSFNPEGIETTNGGYLGPTTSGVQVGASPVARSFTFGLNINF